MYIWEAWFNAALAAAQDYKAEVAVESNFRAYHGGRLYSCTMGGVTVTGLPEKAAWGVSDKIRAIAESAARETVELIKLSLSESAE